MESRTKMSDMSGKSIHTTFLNQIFQYNQEPQNRFSHQDEMFFNLKG